MEQDYHAFTGPIIGKVSRKPFNISQIEGKIAQYWQQLQTTGKKYTNEPLLVARHSNIHCDSSLSFTAQIVNFSYFVYQMDHAKEIDSRYKSVSIAPVMFAKTTDNYYVLGKMAAHTRHAGKVLAPGGAVGIEDLLNDEVQVDHCLLREFHEETGLQKHHLLHYAPFGYYLSKEQPTLIIFYQGKLVLNSREVFHYFRHHQHQYEKPQHHQDLDKQESDEQEQDTQRPHVEQILPELEELRLVERYSVEDFLEHEPVGFYLPWALRWLRSNHK